MIQYMYMKYKYIVIVVIGGFCLFLVYLFIIAEYASRNYRIDYLVSDKLTCSQNNECLGRLVCVDGFCVQPIDCFDDSDCPQDQACIYNICEN